MFDLPEKAKIVLQVVSVLHPKAVPENLFSGATNKPLRLELQNLVEEIPEIPKIQAIERMIERKEYRMSASAYAEARNKLISSSLATSDAGSGILYVPLIVQDVIRLSVMEAGCSIPLSD